MATSPSAIEELTNDRLLRRNVGLNLLGWVLPAIAALASIPMLARALGPSRFGLIGLAWAAVGIFSLFDFGLGRALTRLVAERLAARDHRDVGDLVWAASWILLALCVFLAAIGVATAPAIVDVMLRVPASLRAEAIGVVQLLSIGIPPLAHGVALRGVLEAGQQFGTVNRLRIPLGVASYAGPLLAIPLGGDARIAVGVIVVARIAYWLAHFRAINAVVPGIGSPRKPSRASVAELAHVGGWITVSNVVSPIIVQADRVAVASGFPIAATGWYGAAAEAATKMWLFTAALGPVFFSAVSAAIKGAPQRAADLARQSARVTLLALLPAALVLAAFAEPGLRWWLGPSYDPTAAAALRWLTIGVYVNCIGQIPYFLLQGGVDARAPAIVHLVELPIYLAGLAFLARTMGVEGVAIAWMTRMVIDSAVMWAIIRKRMPEARAAVRDTALLGLQCFALVGLAAAWGMSR